VTSYRCVAELAPHAFPMSQALVTVHFSMRFEIQSQEAGHQMGLVGILRWRHVYSGSGSGQIALHDCRLMDTFMIRNEKYNRRLSRAFSLFRG